ncbi:DUF2207 domain-containing protein [Brumimicrobium glaciale]|uniref:DUF2207 domain-containing protein n=1 Tax=Brumimicrobium glaciale TaxID=200475 RepID=A0A4Q4KKU1_9FLAO|nr:DUF2207 domain-containing protein [Brumimicrobium glaciale]RYM33337.1 DUF2207 domain-containing protein [Brumimicrobium glaciale]
MRYILILLAGFLLSSFTFLDKEKIYSFHSDIQIQADGSVLVTEKIDVLSLGREIRKGIYRDIPLNFRLPEGKIRQVLTVKSAKKSGSPATFRTENINGGIRIYIGSKDTRLINGKHSYEISYQLDRTVFCNEIDCQVMWNVNGNHWGMSIDTLTATIRTPENTEILEFDGWKGKYGENIERNFESKSLSAGKQVFMTSELKPGNNLTIMVTFDKEVMSEVPFPTQMIYFFRDNSLILLTVFGLLISFLVNLVLWLKHGKDPKQGTIIPQFYPPNDWSPAEVLFLMNEGKEDDNMFAAQLLQLAVKGHIKIEKKGSKREDSFAISIADKSSKKQKLTELEKGFLDKLLGTEESTTISKEYNAKVASAHGYLVTEIEKKQAGLYFNKNIKLIFPQYIFPVLTIVGMAIAYNIYEGPVWLIPIVAMLMMIMNIIFLRLFYQPTKEGRKMLDHILGLERFIKYADELRINAINKPDMNFDYFEKNLPYAIAFGKADEWGKKFQAQEIEAQYKSSNYYVSGYSYASLGYFGALSAVSASASVAPSAAGSSGGGFGGGGGFSGGGAGGGGGGGW